MESPPRQKQIEKLGDEIAELSAHIEAATYRLLVLIREFDKLDGWQGARYLRTYTDEDGMLVLRARLTPEVGAAVLRALEAAGDELYKKDAEVSGEQRRADAIGLVAEAALTNGLDNGTRGDRYQVVVHVDAEVLGDPNQEGQSAIEDGPHVSAETSRRLACDSSKAVMIHGLDDTVLDIGRKTRVVSAALRRALKHRDKRCRFPGCDAKINWDGEPMDLDWAMCVLRQNDPPTYHTERE